MTITYEDEPSTAAKPKITYEERRAQPESFSDKLKRLAPNFIGPLGIPLSSVGEGIKAMDKLAYDAGGKVTDVASNLGASPEIAAGAGTVANLGVQSIPMLIGGGAGSALESGGKAVGRALMQSAIKPTIGDLQKGKAQRAIDFMLKEGVNPTEGGVAALRQEGIAIAKQVEDVLKNSNAMVTTAETQNRLLKLAGELEGGTLGVQRSKEVMGILKSFLNHPNVARNAGNMTVQDAQKMKQLNYKELDDAAYGLGVKPAAEAQALKVATNELKKGIEKVAPEVKDLNARGSEIWNAIKVAERRSLIEGNKNPSPLGASFAMASHNPSLTLGMWLNSSAWGKSMLARGVYSSAELGTPLGVFVGTLAGAHSGSAPK